MTMAVDQSYLRRATSTGQPIVYWQLGSLWEERYDVADRPWKARWTRSSSLQRRRTSFRTNIHAVRSSRRPSLASGRAGSRVRSMPLVVALRLAARRPFRFLVPSHAPRQLGAHMPRCPSRRLGEASPFDLRRRVLIVNGQEAGFMAPYGRNLETKKSSKSNSKPA